MSLTDFTQLVQTLPPHSEVQLNVRRGVQQFVVRVTMAESPALGRDVGSVGQVTGPVPPQWSVEINRSTRDLQEIDTLTQVLSSNQDMQRKRLYASNFAGMFEAYTLSVNMRETLTPPEFIV